MVGENIKIEATALKSEDLPAVILVGEQSRRFAEMSKMYGIQISGEAEQTLTLNLSNPVIKKLINGEINEGIKEDVVKQIFDIARITLGQLDAAELSEFIRRSTHLMDIALNK